MDDFVNKRLAQWLWILNRCEFFNYTVKFQWYDKQVEIDLEDEKISAYFSVQLQSKIIGKVHIHLFFISRKTT